ncbi:hypothetical protein ACI2KH_20205 [Roseomonas mucosa]|uniref:hypothetical protein n=1 Tax=Roseomonas mucosa TaxID=207340 RepID=UPI00384B555F
MSDPMREEVERVVAGMSVGQRDVLRRFPSDGRPYTEARFRGEAVILRTLRRKNLARWDFSSHDQWQMTALGRVVAETLRGEGRRTASPPPGEGDGGGDA